jgi:nucleolar pre-ribosomal-associated protein 1
VLPLLAQPNVYSFARTLMPPIYSQLDQDPPITVFRVLTAIWDAITLSSPGISRRISLALVNESSIEFLIKLLGRSDIDMTSGQKVGDIVKGFMEGVTTTPGRGICFADDGWYPREPDAKLKDDDEGDRGNREDKEKKKLHNRILANVIRKLGARVIDDDGKLGNLAVEIVRSCPELVAG